VKFSLEGKVLIMLGKSGVVGNPPPAPNQPNSVVVASNGDICIKSFGKLGSGPTEFKLPHDLTIDPQGKLIVADKGNHRIQILDQEGSYLAEWKQFSRPSGIAIRNGLIYVADSESNGVAPNPGWKRGIRVGNLNDGKVLYRIPDPLEKKGTSAAEGVAVDAKGNVFGDEVEPRQLVKHTKE
jgi:sugar lactone lactonase YvrE